MVNTIRDKLSVHVAERVVNVMVIGNLDYCNSLLHGITAGQLGRLQKIQNTAARLILRRNRRSGEDKQLVVIKTHSHYGDISFQVAAAKLWNAAPFQLKSIHNIDSFKSKLKTYLFILNLKY